MNRTFGDDTEKRRECKPMITTAIGSYKGGTGKTTTTINLAYNLSQKGKRVLVIDADPQANATYMFTQVNDMTKTLADLFQGASARSCIRRTKYERLDIIKGTSRMEEVQGGPEALKEALCAVSGEYDHCLIDCHPSMQLPTIAAMAAAQRLLVPFKPDGYGKAGLVILNDYIHQIQAELNRDLSYEICITKYAGRKSQLQVLQDLLSDYEHPMMETVIRYGEAVNTSIQCRKPLVKHRSKAPVTRDYLELTEEFLRITEGGESDGEY